MRSPEVGISIVPYADSLDLSRELVRAADEGGLPFVGIQDQRHFVDTCSLIPTLLAETRQISFFTDVANLPLGPPAVRAKAAASLDLLSAIVFWPVDPSPGQVEALAGEVAPLLPNQIPDRGEPQ